MWGLTLILLLLPLSAQASCTDNDDPFYNFAVSQGAYEKAFQLVAQELHLSTTEAGHFKIVPGFSRRHDDRHGQADPDTLEVHLDPGLFIEGKEGACQGVAHELTHLRQFERDRRALHAFYASHPVSARGWSGCEHETLARVSSERAEEDAYGCLEDNDLVPHAAADEIDAVMAQIPYARAGVLRDEDFTYLLENIANWADHADQVSVLTNESYYPSELRREDISIFCRGADYARANHADPTPFQKVWTAFCRARP